MATALAVAQDGSRAPRHTATANLTVSAVVVPSCRVQATPADAGRTNVQVTCAERDIARVRVEPGSLQVVAGGRETANGMATARVTVVGSVLQVSF